MRAWSPSRRYRRLVAEPLCGRGVIDPTSTNPKPEALRASIMLPLVSKPAAMPTGDENFIPKASHSSSGMGGA